MRAFRARKVVTMEPGRPAGSLVLVDGDRVRAVCADEDELAAYGEQIEIDERYAGAVIFPGFVEAHTHAFGGGLWKHCYVGHYERQAPDGTRWPGCRSIDDVLQRLADAERELPAGEPLVAWGLDPIFFPGRRLDRTDLDRVSSSRPIFVMHQSFHLATVNSAVIERDRIAEKTGVPGIVTDEQGRPNGELREPQAMMLAASARPGTLMALDDEALRLFGADARNHGITTLVDLGNRGIRQPEVVDTISRVVGDDRFPARLSVFLMGSAAEPLDEQISLVRSLREQRSTAKLRFGHVKLILDGSIQGFTAQLLPPGYLHPERDNGVWVEQPEQFREAVAGLHAAGLTVHVHCNGDGATELFLDAVERALVAAPRWDHRHTVQHSQLSTPAQYRRMAALGVCANIFVNHVRYWGDQHRDLIIGPDRAARMDATRSAMEAGVSFSMHSDSPVTPMAPLTTAAIASTRLTDSGALLGGDERISVHAALHAMTLGAAYQLKMDHEVGSIQAGKLADFAVLDRDPTECEPEDLESTQVLATVLGGVETVSPL